MEISMSEHYKIPCDHCGELISERGECNNVANYHRECAWDTISCEMCGGPIRIHRGWTDPPKTHEECTESNWYKNPCDVCGDPIRVDHGWTETPKTHEECTDNNWYESPCDICGDSMKLHREWADPPTSHLECMAAKWYEKPCKFCGNALSVNRDWDAPPDYHQECEWFEKPCEICHRDMSVSRTWTDVPPSHEECIAKFAPRRVFCTQCGKEFMISIVLQLKYRDRGREFYHQCRDCKYDALLITGAVGALSDRFESALETTLEQRSVSFTENVVIVKNKETSDVVAEIKMSEDGVFSAARVAVAYDPSTKEKFSKTQYGKEGIFSHKRTADTFDRDGKRIHRTKMVENGIIPKTNGTETLDGNGNGDNSKTTLLGKNSVSILNG